jgi:hypothetical protein
MNKLIYVLFILIIIIIFGFVSAQIIQGGVTSCTEMACICEKEGELPCNSCSSEELIFSTAIINIVRICDAREILICRKDNYAGRRYNKIGNCKTKIKWFDLILDYRK